MTDRQGGDRPGDALRLAGVALRRDGSMVLHDLDWRVAPDERWVILGPNGSGKTSLLLLAGAHLHPTRGVVDVLGQRLGRVDVRVLRRRIGFVSGAVIRALRPTIAALDVVMTAKFAALEPWWHEYTDTDRERARSLLEAGGFGYVAERPFGVLSEGERQQVLLARSLMHEPELVLLDEPAAGLDLAARELLVARLGQLADDEAGPTVAFVTHHPEEIPPGFTHALLLREGRAVASGPLDETMTDDALSACFGLRLRVSHEDGRYACRAVRRG